jgi:hypothetical protein
MTLKVGERVRFSAIAGLDLAVASSNGNRTVGLREVCADDASCGEP